MVTDSHVVSKLTRAAACVGGAALLLWLAGATSGAPGMAQGDHTPTGTPTRTPSPTYFVITPEPTPASAQTVIARLTQGVPTRLPSNWVTPIVVTATPTPANQATADRLTVVAYLAALTGTPTPTPINVWTATPTPTYFIITSTPTPPNAATAIAHLAALTTQVALAGPPTPLPPNWVTPIVVTATPTPANQATADRQTVLAYLAALTGTPTPTPINVWTATPTPTYVVITSVPTPANLETALARVEAEDAAAPLPPNWVTPIVVTATPTPANRVTADVIALRDYLTGTPTPTPINVWTATPTPTYFVITSVPTPANALTAEAILQAGIPAWPRTPLPANWVTPIVVTATPPPANAATAERQTMAAYLAALTGTPTPTPINVWTATPTPLVQADAVVLPTITPQPTLSPTPSPAQVPPEFVGRIGFISDRDGGKPAYYIMDADGGNVQRLSGADIYNAALVRDTLDPAGEFQVFVSEPRTPSYDREVGRNTELSLRRLSDGLEVYLIGQTRGADYYPAYCQADPRYIAYTSQQSGNDEIFVVDLLSGDRPDAVLATTRLTENEWAWDKHPSWSPDCRQIVFYSNRDGHSQIWVMDFQGMNFPGGNPRNLSNNPYNDWDPVWFKPPPGAP